MSRFFRPLAAFVGATAGLALYGFCLTTPSPKIDDAPIVTAPPAAEKPKCPSRNPIQEALEQKWGQKPAAPDYGGQVDVSIDGIRDFCSKFTKNPVCSGKIGRKLTFSEVQSVDSALRTAFTYTDDLLMYQQDDQWAENGLCGDCEDYALTLAKRLGDAGAAGETMWLEIWVPDWRAGHATLVIDTADRGLIEISVGDGGLPVPYVPEKTPVRMGRIKMDGKLEVELEPGVVFVRTKNDIYLSKADTKAEARAAGFLKE